MEDGSEGGMDADTMHALRFDGVARLYGAPAAARLRAAHVAVVGLGGVGSWAAEAIARSGVGASSLTRGSACAASRGSARSIVVLLL